MMELSAAAIPHLTSNSTAHRRFMEIKLGSWSGFILGVLKLHRYVYNDGDVRRV